MNVEPGQPGYILGRHDATMNLVDEIKAGEINFKDVEAQVKDKLKKAGYKAPNAQRERGNQEHELLQPTITEKDLSIAINMDMKLFI